MITIPNLISAIRAPLALVFLQTNPLLRCTAILVAMISDGLDGFLARRYNMTSRTGVFLDPLMDKFFVLFAVAILISEGSISLAEAAAFICRDFAIVLFGMYLLASGKLSQYRFRAIWCGKASTFLQFMVLITLNFGITIPSYFYLTFIALGILALVELSRFAESTPSEASGKN